MISNVLNPTNNPDNIQIRLEEKAEGEKTAQGWGISGFCSYGFFRKTGLSHSLRHRDPQPSPEPFDAYLREIHVPSPLQKKKESLRHSQERLFLSMFCFHRDSAQWSMPCSPALGRKPGVGPGLGHRKQEILLNGAVRYWQWPKGQPLKQQRTFYSKAEEYVCFIIILEYLGKKF